MTSTTFHIYAAAKRLREAGFDEDQAEAAVTMVRDAVGADRDALATNTDLAALESWIYRALWMQGAALAALILAARLL